MQDISNVFYRPVGEMFKDGSQLIKVVNSTVDIKNDICEECFYRFNCPENRQEGIMGECNKIIRPDNNNVYFKEVKVRTTEDLMEFVLELVKTKSVLDPEFNK